jgi:hypothetical protein
LRLETNTDPDPIRIQGFIRPKIEKKITAEKKKNLDQKLLLWVIFALLDPDPDPESGSGSTGPIEYGSNPDPKPCSYLKLNLKWT